MSKSANGTYPISPLPAAVQPDLARPARLTSLDAFRGFTMLAMVSGGFALGGVAAKHPDSPVWKQIHYHLEHVEWSGCAAWDLIQPSFMFMVGTSMAFSYAGRKARGDSWGSMFWHALRRSLVLILLGVFLRSNGSDATRWTFEDVISQIGFGYVFLFLLWGRGFWVQLIAAIAVLGGYWALFAYWPLPGPDFDYVANGAQEYFTGFTSHWNKNTNPAHFFDQWFLNLFPRKEPFQFNGGGYLTLSFIPSLGTMIFGLMAGEWLRSARGAWTKVGLLIAAGLICLAGGYALDHFGLCPSVKKIWTPSWAVFSAGWVLLFLAGFYAVIDVIGFKFWAWPAVVVGMNSIAIYVMSWLIAGWLTSAVRKHLRPDVWLGDDRAKSLLGEEHITDIFYLVGPDYAAVFERVTRVFLLWLICWWMYRRRIFIRI